MLEVTEESQEYTEIMRRQEAYGRFGCSQRQYLSWDAYTDTGTNNYCSWSPSYGSVNQLRKMYYLLYKKLR